MLKPADSFKGQNYYNLLWHMQRTSNCFLFPKEWTDHMTDAHEKFNYKRFNSMCNLQSIIIIASILIPVSVVPKLIALYFVCPNQRTNSWKINTFKMFLNFILLKHVAAAAAAAITKSEAQHATTTKMDGSLIRRNVVIYLNEQCPIIAVHFIYHTVASLKNGSAYRWPVHNRTRLRQYIPTHTPDKCV